MSTLHKDDWILRRIYDVQKEIVQVRLTAQEVHNYPELQALLQERYWQLEAVFGKYERILKQKKEALGTSCVI